MKRIIHQFLALCAIPLFLGIVSCKTDDDNGNSSSSPSSSTPAVDLNTQPSKSPDSVLVPSGWYTYSRGPNLLIDVDAIKKTAKWIQLSGLNALVTYCTENDNIKDGDIVSQITATKSWAIDIASWVPAYKFVVGDEDIYMFNSSLLGTVIRRVNRASPDYQTSALGASQLTSERITKWKTSIPAADAIYISEKITVGSDEKYLYGVISESDADRALSLYELDTNDITVFSDYNPIVKIDGFSFQSSVLTFYNSEWNIWIQPNATKLAVRECPANYSAYEFKSLTPRQN